MGKKYNHLTDEERCLIDRLHALGQSGNAIALAIGRNKSTISRELQRNATPVTRRYNAISAERMAGARRWRGSRIERSGWLRQTVGDYLAMGWSPQIIASQLERHHGSRTISHESIYRYVHSRTGRRERLHRYLRQGKARRGWRARKTGRASLIPGRVSIHQRPGYINNRSTFGHWEGDLMSFADQKQSLLVLLERKTRLTLAARLPDKRAKTVAREITKLLRPLPEGARKSITFDNGGEFAGHQKIARKLNLETFFCDPYASWQKGSVENAIGRLRPDLPRKISLKHYQNGDINDLILNYNDTPRKCLGFQTPFEAFIINSNVALQM